MKDIILPTDKYNEFFTRYIKLHQDVLNDIEHERNRNYND